MTAAPLSIRLHASDNVVVARADILPGTKVEGVTAAGHVPAGHKIATARIEEQRASLVSHLTGAGRATTSSPTSRSASPPPTRMSWPTSSPVWRRARSRPAPATTAAATGT